MALTELDRERKKAKRRMSRTAKDRRIAQLESENALLKQQIADLKATQGQLAQGILRMNGLS